MILIYSITVSCSHCGRRAKFEEETKEAAYSLADRTGWYVDDDYNICPDCEEASGRYMPTLYLYSEL